MPKAAKGGARTYVESEEERVEATRGFLEGLRFSRPLRDLRAHAERKACPKCNKRRQYYCYDCLAVTSPESHPPPLRLPINVHVVLHPGETRGKATTLPLATVSPEVTIHTYPTVPELNPATTLVLYPSASAVPIEEVADPDKVENIVFVDSTWHQSKAIAGDERVSQYRHVKLERIVSLFWRFQDRDPYHLATVEAVYHTVRGLLDARAKRCDPAHGRYAGEADDLMFYYINQYVQVQQSYQAPDRTFTGKHFDGYILKKGIDWEAVLDRCIATCLPLTPAVAGAAKEGAKKKDDPVTEARRNDVRAEEQQPSRLQPPPSPPPPQQASVP